MTEAGIQSLPRVLLVHDGELADVRSLLGSDAFGLEVVDRCGGLAPEDSGCAWDLVIASSRHGVDLRLAGQSPPPPLIAILDQDSRTLRTSLRRAGMRVLVRRPVHPAALRALVLHTLYRGPEKRAAPRVSVGAAVRIRCGWRGRDAVLADLSVSGCRLLVSEPLERGRGFQLTIPPEVSGLKKSFSVRARVLEPGPSDEAGCERRLTARFERLDRRQIGRLQATVERHATGPARFAGAPALQPSSERSGERRESDRHAVEQRMVALDAEAARVLMGRDLSLGGMRVDPNPHLSVGMQVDLAAHLPDCDEPVRLRARVHRDDGERGMLLRFDPSDPALRESLELLLDALLVVGVEDGSEGDLDLGDQPVLVTEILATA